MRGLEKDRMGRGQTDKEINRHTDIATSRKNRPKGRFFENQTETDFLRMASLSIVEAVALAPTNTLEGSYHMVVLT